MVRSWGWIHMLCMVLGWLPCSTGSLPSCCSSAVLLWEADCGDRLMCSALHPCCWLATSSWLLANGCCWDWALDTADKPAPEEPGAAGTWLQPAAWEDVATGWKLAWLQSLRACPWHDTCCTPPPARLALPRTLAPQLCMVCLVWPEPGTEWDGSCAPAQPASTGAATCVLQGLWQVWAQVRFTRGGGQSQLVSECQGTSICNQLPLPYL